MDLYFYSPTCGPCKRLRPFVDGVMAEGRNIRKVDITQEPELVELHDVLQVPTFITADGKRYTGMKVAEAL